MQVYWFTGRSLNDLCSTTQIALATGLHERGYPVTFINADLPDSHEMHPWTHQSISAKAPRGIQSRTLAKKMRKWILKNEISSDSVALLDWRIAKYLIPLLQQREIKWMIIDRGPPADKGILSLLQWPSWRRSWKYVRTNPSSHGCVVSEKHRNFVHKKTNVSLSSITVLPAGVDLDRFKTNDGFQKLTLVYHGKLDRNRGVLALPKFLQMAEEIGIDLNLKIIGDGDAFDSLKTMAQQYDNLEVHQTLEQDALAQVLSQCHIGLLPMPESGVWTLASPLKRSEYAASGLAVLGIDHSGHRLEDGEVEWLKLVSQEQFLTEGMNWLKMLANDNSKLEQLKLQARQYAEENMSWKHSIDALEKVLNSVSR